MGTLADQLIDAVGIMVLGMGLVYLFLSVLILGVHVVAKWCASEVVNSKVAVNPSRGASGLTVNTHTLDPKVVAAITLAVQQFRSHTK
ncbi:OadG family transporter subunit [Shewanella sp. CG12_big_fil_rev_8_21_14_0_65_47_15]|uniref:OadG family protein n=1 Tax=Shewanella sp. CG12_big_fil_rev_8_21_14_0_65_47_15 TaxID=1975537 RepID=UPI000CA9DA07|nr:OadG family transporter subunit [Shewanella sp. CG12_big_fil_rev_8_21_14_0_65_47_15]PIW61041.1 MAG: sodium pump decarboxylase subunit gamma [Shewanella sp. CG12_big_fil_rev_8_21_14_0_65_47_15]